jgi:putative aminopeptidase FrvX
MSFHEEGVTTFVRWYAWGIGLSVKEDSYGNLLVYNGKKPQGPVFTAHMDHPGFEVVSTKGRKAHVVLWGKVEPEYFSGAKVIAYSNSGAHGGKVGSVVRGKKFEGRPLFSMTSKEPLTKGDYGHFDLPAVRMQGGKIYTRAADNLMGVAAILDMFTRMKSARTRAVGLFTRGEEVGFLGAFGAIESGLIPKDASLIVLECSSASHAKVAIGDGPVIRVGDWQSSYDPGVDRWIHDVALSLAKKNKKGFQFQRELLKGGRCEACVYVAEGYRTGGIALPLGNYHNQGLKGPAPEYVSIDDYENMVKLMGELVKSNLPSKNFLRKRVEPIRKNYRKLKSKLLNSR